MKFAFINDNEIKKISEFDSEEETSVEAGNFQQIVSIDGLDPEPQVGWIWENGVLRKLLLPISPRQIRLALVMSGVSLSMIDEALNSLPEPTKSFALVSWEYAISFERTDPLVDNVGLLLGWNTAQLDGLWEMAATL